VAAVTGAADHDAMTALSAPRPLPRIPTPAVIAGDLAYLILSLPIGIASFTVAVTGISLAAGLLITLLGIPVLVLTLLACRGLAAFERARAALVLHEPVPGAEKAWRRDGAWETTKAVVTDPGAWRDVLWSVVLMPIGIATFTIAVTVWSVALGFLTSPLWYWALPDDSDDTIPLLDSTGVGWSVLRVLIGLVLVPVAIAVCRGLAQGHARLTAVAVGRQA
jgi:Putative sensor